MCSGKLGADADVCGERTPPEGFFAPVPPPKNPELHEPVLPPDAVLFITCLTTVPPAVGLVIPDTTSWFGKMGVPQSAQAMLLFEELRPGMLYDVGWRHSLRMVVEDMGSMASWELWMAERTERRESQFREGATSRRRVGSLCNNINIRTNR
jgi:hypothetical protein